MRVQPHSESPRLNGHADSVTPTSHSAPQRAEGDPPGGAGAPGAINLPKVTLEGITRSGGPFRLCDIEASAVGWACRVLPQDVEWRLASAASGGAPPAVGDVGLVRIASLGYHKRLFTATAGQLRMYQHGLMLGVFGNRYATHSYEARVEGTEPLHMLTNAGMIGTVLSRHSSFSRPTKLEFVGYLTDTRDRRVNLPCLMAERSQRVPQGAGEAPVVLVVGSSMNSGKTTCTALLARRLSERGMRVSACKLTGSVSPRDLSEFRASGASDVRDFSDYGLPSTSGVGTAELFDLLDRMTADATESGAEIVLMELADGLLQPENVAMLADRRLASRTLGVLLTAACPGSAIYGVERLRRLGHRVLATCGTFTSAPLFVREFEAHCDVPAFSTAGDAVELADHILSALREQAPSARVRDSHRSVSAV